MANVLIPWAIVIVKVLIAIPFLTLLERKVLGYVQSRKGPNKVSYLGLLQPVSDGVKLIIKEMGTPTMASLLLFWVAPLLSFFLMVTRWMLFPSPLKGYFINLGILFFLCLLGLKVYSLLGAGWGSKSKYALLGGIRGAAQTISYEVSLIFILFFPCILEYSYNMYKFYKKRFPYAIMIFPIIFMWLVSCLAETNRAPFDFAEGERELVSGFKIEYGRLEFTFLFLAEYGRILLMSFLTRLLFFPTKFLSYILFGRGITFFFVWIRGSLPRFRYDFLMDLCWKVFLPFTLLSFFLLLC